jgi:hypothetical protein
MASDQTNIVLDACIQVSNQATIIVDALAELAKIKDEIEALGVTLSNYTSEIEDSESIKHCPVATFNNMINTFSVGIATALKALYDGAPTQQCWDALQKARRVS